MSWAPTQLPAASFRQRLWKLASLAGHGLLCLALASSGGGAGPDLRKSKPGVDVVRIAPPKGHDTRSSTGLPKGNRSRPAGIAIDLDQLTLSICEDPAYELIKVLRRSGGYIGVAETGGEKTPVLYVDRIFRVSNLHAMDSSQTHRVDDYFAVRLIDSQQWTDAIGLRNQIKIGPATAVFALFPETFAAQLIAAIRESASTRGLKAVKSVTVRFDSRVPQGIVIDEIG